MRKKMKRFGFRGGIHKKHKRFTPRDKRHPIFDRRREK